jgi:hypothetical protein
MSRLMVMLKTSRTSTRVLAQMGNRDVLRAELPPPKKNTGAAALLLESLSRWCEQPAFAVVYADAEEDSSELGLCDGFGYGRRTEHFEVEVYGPGRRHCLGSFGDLRRLARRGVL